jgi:hypothetical protein
MTSNRSTRSWSPIPRSQCRQLASAGALGSDILKTVIFFGGIVLSVLLCSFVLGRPAPLFKDTLWWVILVALVAGPFLLFEWYLNRRHDQKRLTIDCDHVCFGKSCVQIEDIQSIASGQFRVAMEKYGSHLEKAAVIIAHPTRAAATIKGAKEAREELRRSSITLTTRTGKQIDWIGTLAYFTESDLEEFFALLFDRNPELGVKTVGDEAVGETA